MKLDWRFYKFNAINAELLYAILKLRQDAFIIEQFCPYDDIDFKDGKAIHLVGFQKGNLAAYCRIFKKDLYYKGYTSIGRIAVSSKYRGQKIGVLLIEKAIAYLKKEPIKIESQCYLEGFYSKFGFKKEGKIYSIDGILHQIMIKLT